MGAVPAACGPLHYLCTWVMYLVHYSVESRYLWYSASQCSLNEFKCPQQWQWLEATDVAIVLLTATIYNCNIIHIPITNIEDIKYRTFISENNFLILSDTIFITENFMRNHNVKVVQNVY